MQHAKRDAYRGGVNVQLRYCRHHPTPLPTMLRIAVSDPPPPGEGERSLYC